jgi:ribosomal protein S18 acetylase RimI-like enzyme
MSRSALISNDLLSRLLYNKKMVFPSTSSSCIRPVDPSRDLDAIADLIELCFSPTIDADGKEYIRYLRRMASSRLYHFVYENSPQKASAIEGFVWEEDKRIMGNLTLIPFPHETNPHYLIANVAVHPEYRQKGIAHQLTCVALDEVNKRPPGSIWLHVRNDNEVAIHLYETLGFEERTCRSTWELEPDFQETPQPSNFQVENRSRSEWTRQREWFKVTYPVDLRWNLQLDEKRFVPGLWGQLKDWFTNDPLIHYSLHRSQELEGIITFETSSRRANILWLACPPEMDEEVIQYLIPSSLKYFPGNRPIAVNYPAERGVPAFSMNGWKKQNTLIWMEHSDSKISRR